VCVVVAVAKAHRAVPRSTLTRFPPFAPTAPGERLWVAMSFQKYVSGKPVVQVYLLDNSFRQLLVEPTSTVHVSRIDPPEVPPPSCGTSPGGRWPPLTPELIREEHGWIVFL
jgi:hypothetical protein